MARLAGIRGAECTRRVAEVIEKVGMNQAADRKMGGYSKGMRQRIKVAQAIVHQPQVLILDEPFNGLDPVARRDMAQLLLELAGAGCGILISSHILYEVEHLTHNILLLHKGRLLAQGDIYTIRALIDKHPHSIVLETDKPRTAAQKLIEMESVLSVALNRQRPFEIKLETHSPERFYADLPDLVLQQGLQIQSLYSPDNNLEAVFNYLVQG